MVGIILITKIKGRNMMKELDKLPTFISNRIILRPINIIDNADMFDYAKRENVGPNAGWQPHQSIEETNNIIELMTSEVLTENTIGVFSIVDKKSYKMIGTIGLHRLNKQKECVEFGYVLNPDYWGKGLMLEAIKKIIPWVFDDLELYRIECSHYDFNQQSKRVIEKSGFTFEGISRKKIVLQDGNRCDLYNYAILKDEYENQQLAWQKI